MRHSIFEPTHFFAAGHWLRHSSMVRCLAVNSMYLASGRSGLFLEKESKVASGTVSNSFLQVFAMTEFT